MKTNETISSIQLFSNRHYFWNPLFACLLAKYVAGGLFDERNEGSFFTWGVSFTHNRMTCKLSTRRFYPERPEKSLETPLQCLRVIDQKWPLVVELIDLDRFSKKWAWHLSNRILKSVRVRRVDLKVMTRRKDSIARQHVKTGHKPTIII